MKDTIYEMVNKAIIDSLDRGVIPWKKSWKPGGTSLRPLNATTGNYYQGSNVWVLNSISAVKNLPNEWCTPKQAMSKGWDIKGQHCIAFVTFFTFLEKETKKEDGTISKRRIPLLRQFKVLNASQCKGWEPSVPTEKPEIVLPEDYPVNYESGPRVVNVPGSDRACYSPDMDTVKIPTPEQFTSVNAYYAVLYHELGHSTGHQDRLNRPGVVPGEMTGFGSKGYAREELVAELASAYVCGTLGIDNTETVENTASYINNWSQALKQDPRLFVTSAGKSEKACAMILGLK